MNNRLIKRNLIKGEFLGILGNVMTIFFGVFFPIFMTSMLSLSIGQSIPVEFRMEYFYIPTFTVNASLIAMAIILIGFPATFVRDIQAKVNLRMNLFGYSIIQILVAKAIAYLTVVLLALILYVTLVPIILEIDNLNFFDLVLFLFLHMIYAIAIFIFSYAITILLPKFSWVYPLTMFIYFAIMIISGSMGATVESFPEFIRNISYKIPSSQFGALFPKIF